MSSDIIICKKRKHNISNKSIIINYRSYMWGFVLYSSVENICMRHGVTNNEEAHKASLANPGNRSVTCVLADNFLCFNNLPIIFCNCCEGVPCFIYFLFFIFHFMNELDTQNNKQIVIIINTWSRIYLTGFLFCEKVIHLCSKTTCRIKKNSSNRR